MTGIFGNSLQTRLGLGLFLSLVGVFALLWVVAELHLRQLTEEYVIARLDHDTDNLLSALRLRADGVPYLEEGPIGPIFHRPFSGHYYMVQMGHDLLRSRSLWDFDLGLFPLLSAGQSVQEYRLGPEGQPLLTFSSAFIKQGSPVRILVAEDLSPMQNDLARLRWNMGAVYVAVLLVLILLQRYLLWRALVPLEQSRKLLEQLKQGEIQRLPVRETPDELLPLVEEINRLIQSFRERLERSRNALGNLAHALKTPLALLLQTAERLPADEHSHEQAGLLEQIDRIRELMDRELRRARLAGRAAHGGRIDPVVEIKELIPILERMHGRGGVRIECVSGGALYFNGDREDFLELVGNLLDNGCQWASSAVRVSLHHDSATGLELVIEDDGPGVSEASMPRLRRESARIDEEAAGHGLGLAIVHDVIRYYNGAIHFSRSPTLGGLLVRVVIPD